MVKEKKISVQPDGKRVYWTYNNKEKKNRPFCIGIKIKTRVFYQKLMIMFLLNFLRKDVWGNKHECHNKINRIQISYIYNTGVLILNHFLLLY